MAERSIAAVLKTVEPKGSGGSNPSLSAIFGGDRAVASFFALIAGFCGKPNVFVGCLCCHLLRD